MKYLIFSDVHSNLEALQAVEFYARSRKIDAYIFLGDLVGYNASPNECIQHIQKLTPIFMVRGNHDKAVSGQEPLQSFNPIAAAAIIWTRDTISTQNKLFLMGLKKGPQEINKEITICHGAPYDEDYYIFGPFDAVEAFYHFSTKLCFFGHTHLPRIYIKRNNMVEEILIEKDKFQLKIEKEARYLINPGSLGQPRDRNPKLSFVIYNTTTNKITFHRLSYNLSQTQSRILQAGLPSALADRLALGI
ncbi:MAG: metallophosphoesterase [Candidatus Aminicenantes bacterium]|nr:MAG: metallophosphoesterase [Candidatus Aminicenantes bacterium]RLE03035.1 MAG: metallophosphoesterase [Candidatus Aminicenantes bacterium]